MSDKRFGKAPDTPSSVEIGVPAKMATLRGVGALRGVPPERLEKLETAFLEAMKCDQYQKYLENNGLGPDSIAGSEVYGKQIKEISQDFEIGRASCRERACQGVDLGGRRILKKKNASIRAI